MYSFCMKRKGQPGIERRKAVHDVFGMVRNILEPALIPYVIQLGQTEESQMVATVKRKGDRPDVILKVDGHLAQGKADGPRNDEECDDATAQTEPVPQQR